MSQWILFISIYQLYKRYINYYCWCLLVEGICKIISPSGTKLSSVRFAWDSVIFSDHKGSNRSCHDMVCLFCTESAVRYWEHNHEIHEIHGQDEQNLRMLRHSHCWVPYWRRFATKEIRTACLWFATMTTYSFMGIKIALKVLRQVSFEFIQYTVSSIYIFQLKRSWNIFRQQQTGHHSQCQ